MRVEATGGDSCLVLTWDERAVLLQQDGAVPGYPKVQDVPSYLAATDEAVVQCQRALAEADTAVEMQEWHDIMQRRQAVARSLWNIAKPTMLIDEQIDDPFPSLVTAEWWDSSIACRLSPRSFASRPQRDCHRRTR